jgi:hypothetical protein
MVFRDVHLTMSALNHGEEYATYSNRTRTQVQRALDQSRKLRNSRNVNTVANESLGDVEVGRLESTSVGLGESTRRKRAKGSNGARPHVCGSRQMD